MDHTMGAAGKDHIGVAATDELTRLADGLRAGSAGSQAVVIRPLGPEPGRQMHRGRTGLLLSLMDGVEILDSQSREIRCVHVAIVSQLFDQLDESRKVVRTLSCTKIYAEPPAAQLGLGIAQPGILHRHRRSRQGKLPVAGMLRKATCSLNVVGKTKMLDLGGDTGGESSGVEQSDRSHPALASQDALQVDSRSAPRGVTIPIPVTTTRRISQFLDRQPTPLTRQGFDRLDITF